MDDDPTMLEMLKTFLEIPETVTSFDDELLIYLDVSVATSQNLVLVKTPIQPVNKLSRWLDYYDSEDAAMIMQHTFLNIRKTFDPPSTAALLNSIDSHIQKLEYYLTLPKEGVANE